MEGEKPRPRPHAEAFFFLSSSLSPSTLYDPQARHPAHGHQGMSRMSTPLPRSASRQRGLDRGQQWVKRDGRLSKADSSPPSAKHRRLFSLSPPRAPLLPRTPLAHRAGRCLTGPAPRLAVPNGRGRSCARRNRGEGRRRGSHKCRVSAAAAGFFPLTRASPPPLSFPPFRPSPTPPSSRRPATSRWPGAR